jgi:hypothetical protein
MGFEVGPPPPGQRSFSVGGCPPKVFRKQPQTPFYKTPSAPSFLAIIRYLGKKYIVFKMHMLVQITLKFLQ